MSHTIICKFEGMKLQKNIHGIDLSFKGNCQIINVSHFHYKNIVAMNHCRNLDVSPCVGKLES